MNKIHEDISEEDLNVRGRYRECIDILRSRLSMLSGKDKLLMTMYWENGNSLTQIGKLAGINRISLARRINKITERLMEGKYIACIRNRDRFTGRQMDVAKDYFLMGLSMKKIADQRKLSYYQVREILRQIDGKLESKGSELPENAGRGDKYDDV